MSILGKAQVMRALAEQPGADPNLRRYALDAAIKAENKGAALLQVKHDRDAVLNLMLGLDPVKKCPSDDALAEMLDITPTRAAAGRASAERDGRILSDGTLNATYRANMANQKPGGNALARQSAQDAANARAAEAGTQAAHAAMAQRSATKMVDIKSLHGDALNEAITAVTKGEALLQDGILVYKNERERPVTQRDLAHTRALVNKIQEGRK